MPCKIQNDLGYHCKSTHVFLFHVCSGAKIGLYVLGGLLIIIKNIYYSVYEVIHNSYRPPQSHNHQNGGYQLIIPPRYSEICMGKMRNLTRLVVLRSENFRYLYGEIIQETCFSRYSAALQRGSLQRGFTYLVMDRPQSEYSVLTTAVISGSISNPRIVLSHLFPRMNPRGISKGLWVQQRLNAEHHLPATLAHWLACIGHYSIEQCASTGFHKAFFRCWLNSLDRRSSTPYIAYPCQSSIDKAGQLQIPHDLPFSCQEYPLGLSISTLWSLASEVTHG